MVLTRNGRDRQGATALLIMAAFIALQTGHVFEHVVQLVQKFILGLPVAQGFLGAIFDTEWVHFLFNVVVQAGLVVVYLFWRRSGRPVPIALWVAIALQGVHSIEHVAKMYQYYALGITVGPKGLLGFFFPLIWLHFFLNIPPLAGMLAAWRGLRRLSGETAVPAPA